MSERQFRRCVAARVALAAGTTVVAVGLLAAPATAAPSPVLAMQLNSSLNRLTGVAVGAGLGLDAGLGGATNQLTGIQPSAGLGADAGLSSPLNGLARVTVTAALAGAIRTVPTTPPTTVPETTSTTTHPQQD